MANNLGTNGMSARPASTRRMGTGAGGGVPPLRPGSRANIRVPDRPVTQQGLTGIKTAAKGLGPERSVQDRTYYLGLLRGKTQELSLEKAKITRELDAYEEDNANYVLYEQRAQQLAGEIAGLRGAMNDYNLLIERVGTGAGIEDVEQESEAVRMENKREALIVEQVSSLLCINILSVGNLAGIIAHSIHLATCSECLLFYPLIGGCVSFSSPRSGISSFDDVIKASNVILWLFPRYNSVRQVFSERQRKEEEVRLCELQLQQERQRTEQVVEQLEDAEQDKYRETRREIEAVQLSIDQQEEELLKARRLAQRYEEEVSVYILLSLPLSLSLSLSLDRNNI